MQLKSILKNKRNIAIICIASLLLLICLFSTIRVLSCDTFYDGVRVEDVDIRGLKKDDAKRIVHEKINDLIKTEKIVLMYNDCRWTLDFGDISLKFRYDEAVETAYMLGRKGNLPEKIFSILKLRIGCPNILSETTFDKKELETILCSIKKQTDIEAKNANVSYRDGEIVVNKESFGKTLDIDKNIKMIENHISKREYKDIKILVDEKKPAIIFDDIKEINYILSSFSTSFNPGDINRNKNIELACEKISSTILFPEEVFSMDKALGPRTKNNGYSDAPIIFKNELVKGPGGGVCQVTTTLYNAVLLSMLNVTERTHHSMPLGYVKPGQDATLAANLIDLKFQNNKDYPVCISANTSESSIDIRILGRKENTGYTIKLKSVVVGEFNTDKVEYIIDNSIPDDEIIVARKAKKGLRVILYREMYDAGGKLVKREKISEDTYEAICAQCKVNENYQKGIINKIN